VGNIPYLKAGVNASFVKAGVVYLNALGVIARAYPVSIAGSADILNGFL